jgi:4-hydroxybenzoate polyprenyltransferase
MLKYLLKAMRPRQWTKNVFLLAALVFDRQLFQLDALVNTIQAFIIFCLLSSSVYLFNDVMDIEADKNHPVKRNRPIASGKLPLGVAIIASAVLFLVSIFGHTSYQPAFW